MNGILSALINLGLGGLLAAALIWFLHHLVTKTLPGMQRAYRLSLLAERKLRLREHQALMRLIDQLGQQQHKEHETLQTHFDDGLKEIARLFAEVPQALERVLAAHQRPPDTPKQGPRRRQ